MPLASLSAKLNNWRCFQWASSQEMWSWGSIADSHSFLSLVFLSSDMRHAACLYIGARVWEISQMSYECENVSTQSWINIGGHWNAYRWTVGKAVNTLWHTGGWTYRAVGQMHTHLQAFTQSMKRRCTKPACLLWVCIWAVRPMAVMHVCICVYCLCAYASVCVCVGCKTRRAGRGRG